MKRIFKSAVILFLALTVCPLVCSCRNTGISGETTSSAITTVKNDAGQSETTANQNTTTPAETTGIEDKVYTDMNFAEIDLSPYVKLGEYKNIPITLKKAVITEEKYNSEIDKLLQDNAEDSKITDRKTASGDTLNIDFEGFMDSVAFAGGTAQGQEISLTEQSGYIDGFADGLVDKECGTTVELNLKFPDSYHEASYAGKACVFKVKINYIIGPEKIVPEYNDSFVTKLTNGNYTTTAAFKEYYIEKLRKEEQDDIDLQGKNAIWEEILNRVEIIQLPEQQYMYFYTSDRAAYKNAADANGVDYEAILAYYGTTDAQLLADAKEAVKNDLVYYSILKAENITMDDAEYKTQLAALASDYNTTSEYLTSYYGEIYLRGLVLWQKTMNLLFDYSNVSYGE